MYLSSSLSECKNKHLCSIWHISASTTSATLHPSMLWFTSGPSTYPSITSGRTVRVIFWTSLLPKRPSSHGSRGSWPRQSYTAVPTVRDRTQQKVFYPGLKVKYATLEAVFPALHNSDKDINNHQITRSFFRNKLNNWFLDQLNFAATDLKIWQVIPLKQTKVCVTSSR